MKIIQAEGNFTVDEVKLIRLGCILHDIGRMIKREDHALNGAEIVRQWLAENPKLTAHISDPDKLISLVAGHSDKSGEETDPLLAVIKDADTLDEIGVMSIFMAANHLDRESAFFFHDLLERVNGYELEFCERKMKILNTSAAREILTKKMNFIRSFVNQLAEELDGTARIKELSELV